MLEIGSEQTREKEAGRRIGQTTAPADLDTKLNPFFKEPNLMLVLSRKPRERIRIGKDVILTVVELSPNRVRIGIEAPDATRVLRDELVDQHGDETADDCSGSTAAGEN